MTVFTSPVAPYQPISLPDIGLTSLSEVVQRGQIACGGRSRHDRCGHGIWRGPCAARTIQEVKELGMAGCHIEDQINIKRCGHLDNKTLVETATMAKIAAAVSAWHPNFLIMARTDAKGVEGLEAAINRAKAYVDAGADAIFPEALIEPNEYDAFRKAVDVPLLANMTEFGKTRLYEKAELEAFGFNIDHPVSSLWLTNKAVEDNYRQRMTVRTLKSSTICRPGSGSTRSCATRITISSTRIYLISNCSIQNPKRRGHSMAKRASKKKAVKKTKAGTAQPKIFKGLAGVVADTTSISKVMPETNSLTYRGYAVQDLAAQCSFEEVAYLILQGELPTRSQLNAFKKKERALRKISKSHADVIAKFPRRAPWTPFAAAISARQRSPGTETP